MTNDSHKARLAALVQELSVIHEKVTLASGRESDFYVDMRRSTLHHEAAPLIGHVMLDLLEESGFAVGEEYVAVGGLTMGADPVATAMMHAAASRGLDLDAFVVRKAAKDHGMKRRIEGPDVVGKNVVVLEDTSTTGGSPLEAALALRDAGANVVAAQTIYRVQNVYQRTHRNIHFLRKYMAACTPQGVGVDSSRPFYNPNQMVLMCRNDAKRNAIS